jgi:prepilin-type processing-associated H-X9-DG protein
MAAGRSFAKGNYAAWVSPVHHNFQQYWRAALGGFVPGQVVGQPLSRISDGLANSLLAADVRALDRDWDSRGVWSLPYVSATILAVDHHPIPTNASLVQRTFVPDPNYPADYLMTPNANHPDQLVACSQPNYAASQQMPCEVLAYAATAPRSNHPGGVNAVFLDGHTQFLSNDVNPLTMTYLVSVHDGHSSSPYRQRKGTRLNVPDHVQPRLGSSSGP